MSPDDLLVTRSVLVHSGARLNHPAEAAERCLSKWGLDDQDIDVISGADATRDGILREMFFFLSESRFERLVLVFWGSLHLLELGELGAEWTLLLSPSGTGVREQVPFADIVGILQRFWPKQLFLIFDEMQLDSHAVAPAGPPLDEVFLGVIADSATYISGCTQDGRSVLEIVVEKSVVARGTASFVASISSAMRHGADHGPCVSVAGLEPKWPLQAPGTPSPKESPIASRTLPPIFLPWWDALSSALAAPGARVWLHGESGQGKTTASLAVLEGRAKYIALPDSWFVGDDLDRTKRLHEMLAGEIARSDVLAFPSGRPVSSSLSATVSRVTAEVLVIDNLERATDDECTSIATSLEQLTNPKILYVSQRPPPKDIEVSTLTCRSLTKADADRIVDGVLGIGTSANERRDIFAAGSGNIAAVLSAISDRNAASAKSKFESDRFLRAVLASGGFIDLPLFSATFALDPSAGDRLSRAGDLVVLEGEAYIPHDRVRIRIADVYAEVPPESVIKYWELQVNALPHSLFACRTLITKALELDIVLTDATAGEAAIRSLAKSRNWELLRSMAAWDRGILRSSAGAGLTLAEELVRRADLRFVERITTVLGEREVESDEKARLELVRAERLWWYGDYDGAIAIGEKVRTAFARDPSVFAAASLQVGIALWFAGRWEEGRAKLIETQLPAASPRTAAWADFMLATLDGLRGHDVEQSGVRFTRAISVLNSIGDDIGESIAWGNYGEMSWKAGNLVGARLQLERALKIAADNCGAQQILELLRNQLQVELRLAGPWADSIKRIEETIAAMLNEQLGPSSKMQVLNTLATLAAIRGEVNLLQDLLSSVAPLTRAHHEFDIYTRANSALLRILQREVDLAVPLMAAALELCSEGGNIFAAKQLRGDVLLLAQYQPDLSHIVNTVIERLEESMEGGWSVESRD